MKRGVSQIDWIISLAIFLLWMSWFFIFVKPQFDFNTNKNSVMIPLKSRFIDEFTLELHRYPIFIDSNTTGRLVPIITRFNSNDTDLRLGYDYIFWRGNLIFLANLTDNTTTFWAIEGTDYSQNYSYSGLEIDERDFSTTNFSVRFNDGLAETVKYKGKGMFEEAEYAVNGIDIEPTNHTIEDYGFMGIYTSSYGNFNITSMVFSSNSAIYSFLNYNEDYDLAINMDLEEFEHYYSDNLLFGDFNFTEERQQLNFTAAQITLYGKNAFSMYFDGNVTFNCTYFNESIELIITIPVRDEYEYDFIMHDGDYEDAGRRNYDVRYGAYERLSGIYLDNITTNYSYYKEKWGIDGSFNINVYENSSAYRYLYTPVIEIGEAPGKIGVYAETEDLYALDLEGEYSPMTVNFKVW
jgi:hypothetical protein